MGKVMTMTRSSLCTYTNITSNHSNGRGGNSVCKITPHYMCAYWSGRGCADYFASTSRQASSNYCIGVNGDIAMSVDEDDRAWTSSSGWNDRQAITIECGNNDDSSLSDATWESLVSLCVDICQRYGFSLNYTGDQYGSLTEHRMFASTDCPGEWLHANMSRLADEVNARLNGESGSSSSSSSVSGKTGTGFGGSYTVTEYAGSEGLNVRSEPSLSGSITGQLPVGYTVVLDDWYTSADGYIWGRYTANSGGTRYVAVGRATGQEEADDFLIKASYQYDLPAGEYTFTATMNVRTEPSTDSSVVAQYQAGQSVVINSTTVCNGYVWGAYTGASSGATRYVALATADGSTKYVR